MSRRIHLAELAVTSDGDLLLNAAMLDVTPRLDLVWQAARSQRGRIFVGVPLTRAEVHRLRADAVALVPNVTGPIIAARLRGITKR